MVNSPKKIILSYSGGLDTSTVLKWLQEEYQAEVIAFYADLGQKGDLDAVREKAKKIGASKVYIKDLKEEFAANYAFKAMKAGALYQGKYPLSSSLSRPLLARELVAIAQEENADAIAHGCTGKGNDQLRFYAAISALNPELELLTPLIDWPMQSRDEQIEYAQSRGIDIPITEEAPYSLDENLWGRSIGCGPLEELSSPLAEDIFELTKNPQDAPNKAQTIDIFFESGIPCQLDSQAYDILELISILNQLGGEHGIGRIEHMEDKVVGIKAREAYECPGAVILHRAHADLEELTLDKETLDFKCLVAQKYAELIYSGLWFSPLKEALDRFVDSTQKFVTGKVRVQLYKGNCKIIGRESQYALYNYALSTYDRNDIFDHQAGKGFTHITALPLKVLSKVRNLNH